MKFWTHTRIVDAIVAWTAENGRPPKAKEWAKATPDHPAPVTVAAMFGSWNAGILAAGLEPRPPYAPGRYKAWTQDAIAAAFLDFLLRERRWPTATDCGTWRNGVARLTPGLPHFQTVRNHFGSLSEAKRYAGWDGTSGETVVEPKCVECGAELGNVVVGCKTCADRARTRRVRSVKSAPGLVGVESAGARIPLAVADGRSVGPEHAPVSQTAAEAA